MFADGHHLWETEAKVDKDSIKSVSMINTLADERLVTHSNSTFNHDAKVQTIN